MKNSSFNQKSFFSCTEYLEDLILYDALSLYHLSTKGFYVDIGANDPFTCSVTNYFYQEGWIGINVEPIPEKYKLLVSNRPNDINTNICISSKESMLDLHLAGQSSTVDNETLKTSRKTMLTLIQSNQKQ